MKNQKSGFAVTALVLGIIGIVLSFIPIINTGAFILGILALIFGVVGLLTHNKKGMCIAGIIIGILAMVISFQMQSAFSKALDETTASLEESSNELQESLDDMTGDNTEELLGTVVDVALGEFSAEDQGYGLYDTKLPVTVTNLTEESKSFSIQVEAVDDSGNRVGTDYIYANSLGAGQSCDYDTFSLISSDDVEAYQSATFRIVEVSAY